MGDTLDYLEDTADEYDDTPVTVGKCVHGVPVENTVYHCVCDVTDYPSVKYTCTCKICKSYGKYEFNTIYG